MHYSEPLFYLLPLHQVPAIPKCLPIPVDDVLNCRPITTRYFRAYFVSSPCPLSSSSTSLSLLVIHGENPIRAKHDRRISHAVGGYRSKVRYAADSFHKTPYLDTAWPSSLSIARLVLGFGSR